MHRAFHRHRHFEPGWKVADGMDVELALAAEFEANILIPMQVCDDLERVSDELPAANTHAFLMVSERICPLLRQCQHFEETRVHPVLIQSRPGLDKILARLRDEHIEDQDHASLLLDSVRAFVTGDGAIEAGEIGYLARGFFTSVRRHLAFDTDFVAPIMRDQLG